MVSRIFELLHYVLVGDYTIFCGINLTARRRAGWLLKTTRNSRLIQKNLHLLLHTVKKLKMMLLSSNEVLSMLQLTYKTLVNLLSFKQQLQMRLPAS